MNPALQGGLLSTPPPLKSLCDEHATRSLVCSSSTQRMEPTEYCATCEIVRLRSIFPGSIKILAGSNPSSQDVDSDRWASERNYRQQDGQRALRHFTPVARVCFHPGEKRPLEDWERPARHAIFGQPSSMNWSAIVASHEQGAYPGKCQHVSNRVELNRSNIVFLA